MKRSVFVWLLAMMIGSQEIIISAVVQPVSEFGNSTSVPSSGLHDACVMSCDYQNSAVAEDSPEPNLFLSLAQCGLACNVKKPCVCQNTFFSERSNHGCCWNSCDCSVVMCEECCLKRGLLCQCRCVNQEESLVALRNACKMTVCTDCECDPCREKIRNNVSLCDCCQCQIGKLSREMVYSLLCSIFCKTDVAFLQYTERKVPNPFKINAPRCPDMK